MLNQNTQGDGGKTEVPRSVYDIETQCLELKGVAACISLLADAQVYGPHEYGNGGNSLSDALYFLSGQVRRIEEETRNLLFPHERKGVTS
jgi:hypothetical protein